MEWPARDIKQKMTKEREKLMQSQEPIGHVSVCSGASGAEGSSAMSWSRREANTKLEQ